MHLPEAAACPLHDTIQHWNGFQNPSQIAEGIQPCFPVVRSYARLLHMTTGTERCQLQQAWSTCMPQELTKILEEAEVELNNANS